MIMSSTSPQSIQEVHSRNSIIREISQAVLEPCTTNWAFKSDRTMTLWKMDQQYNRRLCSCKIRCIRSVPSLQSACKTIEELLQVTWRTMSILERETKAQEMLPQKNNRARMDELLVKHSNNNNNKTMGTIVMQPSWTIWLVRQLGRVVLLLTIIMQVEVARQTTICSSRLQSRCSVIRLRVRNECTLRLQTQVIQWH